MRILKKEFIKNVLYLASGTAIAQAIPVLISPLLTRLYSPENFGTFSLFLSIISIFSIIASARYELAIVLPEKEEDSVNLIVLCMVIVSLISLLIFIFSFFYKDPIAFFLNNAGISKYLPLVSLSIFLIGIYQVLNSWLTRTKRFKISSIGKIGQAVSNSAAKLTLGSLEIREAGLIAGDIIGQIVIILILLKNLYSDIKAYIKKISLTSVIHNLKRYSDFPKYYLLTGLLDSFTIAFPVFIISKSYGSEVTGYYGLMNRTISIPISIIALSVAQVYFQRVVELRNKQGDIKSFVIKTLLYLLLTALPVCLILIFLGPFLFGLVFGQKWIPAGEYARIFAFAFLIRFITSPLTLIFAALEKIKLNALWQVICFFSTYITLLLASSLKIKFFLIVFTLHDIILYSFYLFLIIKVANSKVN